MKRSELIQIGKMVNTSQKAPRTFIHSLVLLYVACGVVLCFVLLSSKARSVDNIQK